MKAYTLFELNEYVKRVLALNFEEPIWISCEITQVKVVRGNIYLELVQQDDNGIIAQSSAIIWNKSGIALRKKLGNLLTPILRSGSHIKAKVQVSMNERYGLKLMIEDIDPTYTMGQMSIKRQEIVDKLKADGLDKVNGLLTMPNVPQRIAVISSETAAGYQDFHQHLSDNSFGYKFAITFYQASMQGDNTEADVCDALYQIDALAKRYDAVTIIRGGGSRLDLSYFDSYAIGEAIAKCRIPVITGIGHDIDESVADKVSHIALKTPTSVADYLLERVQIFESNILDLNQRVGSIARQVFQQQQMAITHVDQQLLLITNGKLQHSKISISKVWENLITQSRFVITEQKLLLNAIDKVLIVSDPKAAMKMGYAVLKMGDQFITEAKGLQKGDTLEAFLQDGMIKVTVQ